MPTIETLLQPHLQAEAKLQRRLADLEEAARQTEVELMGVQQRIQGIRDAAELLQPLGESNKRKRGTGQRARSMSEHWQLILRKVGTRHSHFSYGDLDEAAREIGRPLANDSLRSQMSDYKSRGWIETVGLGAFRLTVEGRKAAGITDNSSAAQSQKENEAPNGNAAGASEAGRWGVTSAQPVSNNPNHWRRA